MLIIILSFSSIFISCSKDEPVAPQEEHFEAEGMVFYQSGIKIVEIFRGVTSDTFFVPLGDMTSGIKVKFLNPKREEINPPDYKKQPLAWQISDTSKVGVWQHSGEEGNYEFHFVGKNDGRTEIEFFILHEGHPDFRSGKIPVVVR